MKYPQIEFYKGTYNLDFEVPENYDGLVKKIDEDFKKGMQNYVKIILNEFDITCRFPNFQWDQERGLHAIYIGDGRGAYLAENKRYIFKNIDESYQALAVFNILSSYLNRLQESKK